MAARKKTAAPTTAIRRPVLTYTGDTFLGRLESTMRYCKDLEKALSVQMTMGDDRAVLATYVAGGLSYSRPAQKYA
ncbi:MAG: hypothetical protein PVH05_04625 [Burkholderiales bacterium]|jgi:hypothetical protein